jgi:transcriptional regulator with XRE-family HTH domain
LPDDLITPAQSRAGRALISCSQGELATMARVARQTIVDFERGARTPYANNLAAIRAALETAGVIFIAENGDGAGVRLRKDTSPAPPVEVEVRRSISKRELREVGPEDEVRSGPQATEKPSEENDD